MIGNTALGMPPREARLDDLGDHFLAAPEMEQFFRDLFGVARDETGRLPAHLAIRSRQTKKVFWCSTIDEAARVALRMAQGDWARNGIRGVRIETIRVGGTLCTSLEALQRFFDRLSATGVKGRG